MPIPSRPRTGPATGLQQSKLLEQEARDAARKVFLKHDVRLPVDVFGIIKAEGLRLSLMELEPSVSGALVVQPRGATVVVNSTHHPNRQRFTAAHEFGHYVLHRSLRNEFVDGAMVQFRNSKSSEGTNRQEVQANLFAGELLMPAHHVKKLVTEQGVDVMDERAMRLLALRFGVSVEALTVRMVRLGLADLTLKFRKA
jgi:hypothetical protein